MVVFKNWDLTCILPSLQNPIQRQGVLVKFGLKRLFWFHYFQIINCWSQLTFPSDVCKQVDRVCKKSQRVEGHFLLKGEHRLKNKATVESPSLFAAWYCRRFDKISTSKLSKTSVGISNLVKGLIFKTASAFEDATIKDYIFTSPVPTWLCMFWPTGRSAT